MLVPHLLPEDWDAGIGQEVFARLKEELETGAKGLHSILGHGTLLVHVLNLVQLPHQSIKTG